MKGIKIFVMLLGIIATVTVGIIQPIEMAIFVSHITVFEIISKLLVGCTVFVATKVVANMLSKMQKEDEKIMKEGK